LEMTPELHAAARMQALIDRQAIARSWARFQLEHPLILGPASTQPPFTVGADLTVDGIAAIVQSMSLALAVNLLGLPSAAFPSGSPMACHRACR
jgi:amidase